MRRTLGPITLALAFLRFRWAQAALVLLLAAVLAGVPTAFGTLGTSYFQAVRDSIAADLGSREYALNTTARGAVAALNELPSAASVDDTTGTVRVGDSELPVEVRTTTDPSLELGILVDGARPARPGEAMLSSATARALGVGPGGEIELARAEDAGPSTVRLTGLTADPADRMRSTAYVLGDGSVGQYSRWLSDTQFWDDARLGPYLERRTAVVRSAAAVLEENTAGRPYFEAVTSGVPVGGGLVVAAILAGYLALLSRRWRVDATGLAAAGMSAAAVSRFFVGVVTALVLTGLVLGSGLAMFLVHAARRPLSAQFGQEWLTTAPDWRPIVILAALVLVAAVGALVVVPRAGLLRRLVRPPRDAAPARSVAPVVAVVAVVVLVVGMVSTRGNASWGGDVMRLAAVALAGAAPAVVVATGARRLPRAVGRVVRTMAGGLRTVVAAATVVALVAGYWAAWTTASANSGERMSSPLVPPGSFAISNVPGDAADALEEAYSELGGREVRRLGLVDEQAETPRVVTPQASACIADGVPLELNSVPEECWMAGTSSALSVVAVGEPGSQPLADPHLISGGEVGVLRIVGAEAIIEGVDRVLAQPDSVLGGTLPGLLLPPESPLLERYGLVPSASYVVALLDFGELPAEDQMRVRAAASRLAPGAETADGTAPTEYDSMRSTADAVAILGAALAALLMVLGALAVGAAHSVTRRTLAELPMTPRRRRSVYGRWLTAVVVPPLLVVPLTWLVATLAGMAPTGDLGLSWLVPGLVLLVATGVACRSLVQVPPRAEE